MAVFEWVRDKVALVVRAIVPIPMVVVHVRNGIDTAFMALDFRLGVDLAFGRRTFRNTAVIPTRAFVMLFRTLRKNWYCYQKSQSYRYCKTEPHGFFLHCTQVAWHLRSERYLNRHHWALTNS